MTDETTATAETIAPPAASPSTTEAADTPTLLNELADADGHYAEAEGRTAEDEEKASTLYKPPAKRAAEREATETKTRETATAVTDSITRETVTKAGQVSTAHTEALRHAAPEFTARVQRFQNALGQLSQVQDVTQRQVLEQALRVEAQWLQERHGQIVESSLASEQGRLLRELPALSNATERQQLVSWALSKGITMKQIENAGVEDVKRAYAQMTGERIAAKRVADTKAAEKTERKQERRRVESLPMHVRIKEMRGEPDATVMLYGDDDARRAHRRAVQRNQKGL